MNYTYTCDEGWGGPTVDVMSTTSKLDQQIFLGVIFMKNKTLSLLLATCAFMGLSSNVMGAATAESTIDPIHYLPESADIKIIPSLTTVIEALDSLVGEGHDWTKTAVCFDLDETLVHKQMKVPGTDLISHILMNGELRRDDGKNKHFFDYIKAKLNIVGNVADMWGPSTYLAYALRDGGYFQDLKQAADYIEANTYYVPMEKAETLAQIIANLRVKGAFVGVCSAGGRTLTKTNYVHRTFEIEPHHCAFGKESKYESSADMLREHLPERDFGTFILVENAEKFINKFMDPARADGKQAFAIYCSKADDEINEHLMLEEYDRIVAAGPNPKPRA